MEKRKYVNHESKYVFEWCKKFIPLHLQWRRIGLGKLPNNDPAFAVLRKFADVVFFTDNHVNIVEAKIEPDAKAIGQLLQYQKLFYETPEFTEYHKFKTRLIFLTTSKDNTLFELCTKQGMSYITWCPNWLNKVILERRERKAQ